MCMNHRNHNKKTIKTCIKNRNNDFQVSREPKLEGLGTGAGIIEFGLTRNLETIVFMVLCNVLLFFYCFLWFYAGFLMLLL